MLCYIAVVKPKTTDNEEVFFKSKRFDWQIIEKIQNDQRVRKHPLRSIWDAIFYITKSGCQWRILPTDFAPWQTVYYYFRKGKREGLIEEIHDVLVTLAANFMVIDSFFTHFVPLNHMPAFRCPVIIPA